MMNNHQISSVCKQARLKISIILVLSVVGMIYGCTTIDSGELPVQFNAQRAFQDVEKQVSLGPRTPDSPGHRKTAELISLVLDSAGWEVQIQDTKRSGFSVKNIIGKYGQGRPIIIFGAHYDTRMFADRDLNPANQGLPVPGANDGASGVAVLLELARILPSHLELHKSSQENKNGQVWLVFFDAEDNGKIAGREWILGSRAFVEQLIEKPDAAIIIDMIGDANLDVYKEKNSTPELVDQIWSHAEKLGYGDKIIPKYDKRIIDDHVPFIEAGIPSVDIIDFNYPYYHTVQDTPDKVSPASLKLMGELLLSWLINHGLQ